MTTYYPYGVVPAQATVTPANFPDTTSFPSPYGGVTSQPSYYYDPAANAPGAAIPPEAAASYPAPVYTTAPPPTQQVNPRNSGTIIQQRRVQQQIRPSSSQQSQQVSRTVQQQRGQKQKPPSPPLYVHVDNVSIKAKSSAATPRQQKKSQQASFLQTLQTQQRSREPRFDNVVLSKWNFASSSDPQFFLEGKKLMILPEKLVPRQASKKIQYRLPENYSEKAIVVREIRNKKEVYSIYYLNIYGSDGKRVVLQTNIVMPS